MTRGGAKRRAARLQMHASWVLAEPEPRAALRVLWPFDADPVSIAESRRIAERHHRAAAALLEEALRTVRDAGIPAAEWNEYDHVGTILVYCRHALGEHAAALAALDDPWRAQREPEPEPVLRAAILAALGRREEALAGLDRSIAALPEADASRLREHRDQLRSPEAAAVPVSVPSERFLHVLAWLWPLLLAIPVLFAARRRHEWQTGRIVWTIAVGVFALAVVANTTHRIRRARAVRAALARVGPGAPEAP